LLLHLKAANFSNPKMVISAYPWAYLKPKFIKF
jgi:hypothetical protein